MNDAAIDDLRGDVYGVIKAQSKMLANQSKMLANQTMVIEELVYISSRLREQQQSTRRLWKFSIASVCCVFAWACLGVCRRYNTELTT